MSTIDRLRERIAELVDVEPAEIGDDDLLPDHGLDSIRVMALVESWRADGITVSFADLAETPTLKSWATLLDANPPSQSRE